MEDADLSISALTVRETTKGVAKLRTTKPERALVLGLAGTAIFDACDGWMPIDRSVAATSGEALATSETHIDDAGLAATAPMYGLIVVTRHIKDVGGRGVKRLDPFKAARGRRPLLAVGDEKAGWGRRAGGLTSARD